MAAAVLGSTFDYGELALGHHREMTPANLDANEWKEDQ
jgi:hypothetical protein